MNKILTLLLMLAAAEIVFAQQSKIDSLQTLLKKNKPDTNKVNNLNELAKELWYSKTDTVIILSSQALSIAEKLQWKKGIANSLGNLGTYYYIKGNYSIALNNNPKTLKMYKELNNKAGYIKGNYSIALNYNLQALKIDEELNNKTGISKRLNNIGLIYNSIGLINTIGNLYNDKGDYSKALDYYVKAREIDDKLSNRIAATNEISLLEENIIEIYENMAFRATANREYAKAEELYKQSLDYYNNAIARNSAPFNEEHRNEILRKQMKYELNIKEVKWRTGWAQKVEEVQQQIKKIKRIFNSVIAGFFLVMLLFSVVVFLQKKKITKEKQRSDKLLLNILPSEVAEELKLKGESEAKQFDDVTVLFIDFVNFTGASEKLSPKELVSEIHHCFTAFDEIIGRNGMEKIKTIGDAYLAVCGLPNADEQHARKTVIAAQEILKFMSERKKEMGTKDGLGDVRIGINSGSVVAGIVGVKKFAYDIWGDTVNIAARMQQNCDEGKINISGATHELVKDKFKCIHRGKIEAKNKGMIDMYFVEEIL